jgi:uncharacterized protein (TIGR02596 family)
MSTPTSIRSRWNQAHSLVEILVVVAAIALIMSIAGNGLSNSWRSQQIAGSAAAVAQACKMAQAYAIKQNVPVQLRIYKVRAGEVVEADPHFRAYHLVGVSAQPGEDRYFQITELQQMEGTTVVSSQQQYSTLVASENPLGDNPGGGSGESFSYLFVEFRPNGSTNLEVQEGKPWTLTFVNDYDGNNARLPKDARTLVIGAETGTVKVY